MTGWKEYLKTAVDHEASDVFFVAGRSACEKREGHIVPMDETRLMPEDTEKIITEMYSAASRPMTHFLERGDDDFRLVSFDIPDWQEWGIPAEVMALAEQTSGMILVTGTAGSGKTTTQACIIDRINRSRDCHIVTLEDPIEYLHRHQKSIVSQREVTIDTQDYLSALRACVRQAPDVILLGEMRDAETMHTAMSAAETGHMVIATLHTKGAANAVDRIIDMFPSTQQPQIRIQLATVLKTVVSQQLLPDKDGGMIPACEIMHASGAIRSMIRDNKNHQIDNAIAAGGAEGMISMDQAILKHYREGKITKETALLYADRPEQMKRNLT